MSESPDLTYVRDGELMVVHVEGHSDAGVEFVDLFMPDGRAEEMQVVDSGRIVVPFAVFPEVEADARAAGLTIVEEEFDD